MGNSCHETRELVPLTTHDLAPASQGFERLFPMVDVRDHKVVP